LASRRIDLVYEVLRFPAKELSIGNVFTRLRVDLLDLGILSYVRRQSAAESSELFIAQCTSGNGEGRHKRVAKMEAVSVNDEVRVEQTAAEDCIYHIGGCRVVEVQVPAVWRRSFLAITPIEWQAIVALTQYSVDS